MLAALCLDRVNLSQALLLTILGIAFSTCCFSSLLVIHKNSKRFGAENCCLVSTVCSIDWPWYC